MNNVLRRKSGWFIWKEKKRIFEANVSKLYNTLKTIKIFNYM